MHHAVKSMTASDESPIARSYIDAKDKEHFIADETIARLQEIIGDGRGAPAPLVTGGGRTVTVGPGELVLEDGSTVDVKAKTPRDLPAGYHTFTGENGEQKRIIVSPGRCHLPPNWRGWGW